MDNHDSGRSLSRYGSDLPEYRKDAAKMLAVYLGTLSGTLFLRQGQEIDMANAPESWTIDDYIDVEGLNYYNRELKKRGAGADMSDVMREMRLKARDNGRLPMQWNADKNGGFTQGSKPWMRVNDDFSDWNVAQQEKDDDSVLAFWRQVLKLRQREKDVFVYGWFEVLREYEHSEHVFAHTMTSYDGRVALVLLNFSGKEQNVELKGYTGWKKLLGKNAETLEAGGVKLKPYEGWFMLAGLSPRISPSRRLKMPLTHWQYVTRIRQHHNQPACRAYPELAAMQDNMTSAFLEFLHGHKPWETFNNTRKVMF